MTEGSLRRSIIFRGQSIWKKWTVVWKARTRYTHPDPAGRFSSREYVSIPWPLGQILVCLYSLLMLHFLKYAKTFKASAVSGHTTVLIQRKSSWCSYYGSAGFCVHSCSEGRVQFTKLKDHPKEKSNFPPELQLKILLKWLEVFHPTLLICSFISHFAIKKSTHCEY